MDVQLAAGVAVKLASDDIAAVGGSVVDALSSSTPHPLYLSLSASSGSPTVVPGGTAFMGSPPVGRIWEVVSFSIVGGDAFTAVATGAVALCIGNSANPVLNHVRVPALSLPQYRGVSSDGLWVHSNEELYFLISSNMPANQVFYLQVQVQEWREADISMSNPGYSPIR